jgi:uncharacterized Zn-finger protein
VYYTHMQSRFTAGDEHDQRTALSMGGYSPSQAYAPANHPSYRPHDSLTLQRSHPATTASYGHYPSGSAPPARYSPHYAPYEQTRQAHPYNALPQQSAGRPRTYSQTQSYSGPQNEHSYAPYQSQSYMVPSQGLPPQAQQERWEQAAMVQRPHTSFANKPPPPRIDTAAPEGYFSSSHSPHSSYGNSPVARDHLASVDANSSAALGARPHVCDVCQTAFARGHDLKRHKETHSNTKPHSCECGKSFTRKDALKRHVFLKSCGKDGKDD